MSTREPAQIVESVRTHFVERYGREPDGVWSAPGRVNLIGEHTDYNGGLCLPIALPHRTFAAAAVRDDGVLLVCSLQSEGPAEVAIDDIAPGRPGGWASYVAGVLWALREQGHDVPGLDVVIDSVVPVGAGLSSSAALECSVGAAVSDLAGLGLLDDADARARLAQACIRAENEIAGAPTGGLDQSAALLCDDATALLLDCRSWQNEPVPFDLAAAGCALLVTDTRAHHELVDGQYAARRDACEEAARILGVDTLREVPASGLDAALHRLPTDEMRRRVRHVVTEIDRVERAVAALRAGDLDEVGRLFDASHVSMRDDYEISCDELDVATETARRHGALGARMTGGGFGGSCIAIVRADAVDEVSRAIDAAFAERGFTAPSSFAVTAGSSARRDA